jgi:hypothetical protein
LFHAGKGNPTHSRIAACVGAGLRLVRGLARGVGVGLGAQIFGGCGKQEGEACHRTGKNGFQRHGGLSFRYENGMFLFTPFDGESAKVSFFLSV